MSPTYWGLWGKEKGIIVFSSARVLQHEHTRYTLALSGLDIIKRMCIHDSISVSSHWFCEYPVVLLVRNNPSLQPAMPKHAIMQALLFHMDTKEKGNLDHRLNAHAHYAN